MSTDQKRVTLSQSKLSMLVDRVALEVSEGRLPSAQVAVGHDGELVSFETFGDAHPNTRYRLQSVSRPFIAGALWKAVDEYDLDLRKPVSTWIPGFCAGITPRRGGHPPGRSGLRTAGRQANGNS